jgi:hypothetical protein
MEKWIARFACKVMKFFFEQQLFLSFRCRGSRCTRRGRPIFRAATSYRTWQGRELAEEKIVYLYLDAIYPKVCSGGKVVSLPVLVALGVRENGEKVLLSLHQSRHRALTQPRASRAHGTPVERCPCAGSASLTSIHAASQLTPPRAGCVPHPALLPRPSAKPSRGEYAFYFSTGIETEPRRLG